MITDTRILADRMFGQTRIGFVDEEVASISPLCNHRTDRELIEKTGGDLRDRGSLDRFRVTSRGSTDRSFNERRAILTAVKRDRRNPKRFGVHSRLEEARKCPGDVSRSERFFKYIYGVSGRSRCLRE